MTALILYWAGATVVTGYVAVKIYHRAKTYGSHALAFKALKDFEAETQSTAILGAFSSDNAAPTLYALAGLAGLLWPACLIAKLAQLARR